MHTLGPAEAGPYESFERGHRTRRRSTDARPVLVAATMVVLAWGALAFAAVYPWAYTPLLVGAATVGLAGCVRPAPDARVPRAVVAALLAVAIAALLQLVPLPQSALQAISPATHRFLQNYSIEYALAAVDGHAHHAISIVPSRTWLALGFLAGLTLLMVGTARMLTRDALRSLAGGIAVLGVALTLIGVVQAAMWNGRIYGFWQTKMGGSPFGPFVNKNHFAGWMLMSLPLTLGLFAAQVTRGAPVAQPGFRQRVLWWSSRDASQGILAGFAALMMGLGLLLTLSRSGIIAFLLAMALSAIAVLRRQAGGARRAVIVGAMLLLPIIIGEWVGFAAIADRFSGTDTVALSGRGPIWRDTWRIISDFAPFGTGLNTYGYATLFYQVTLPTLHLAEAHNDYLQLAAEGGLLLGVPIALAIGAFAREIRHRFAEGESAGTGYWLRVGAVTGIVAIAIQSAAEFSLQMPGNAALFAILAGIAVHRTRRPPGAVPTATGIGRGT